MPLPVENLCGLAGALLVFVAPARDQWLRFEIWRSKRDGQAEKNAAIRKVWNTISSGYEAERNAWNGWDSLSMAVGALLIAASYVIGAGS